MFWFSKVVILCLSNVLSTCASRISAEKGMVYTCIRIPARKYITLIPVRFYTGVDSGRYRFPYHCAFLVSNSCILPPPSFFGFGKVISCTLFLIIVIKQYIYMYLYICSYAWDMLFNMVITNPLRTRAK